MCHAVGFEGRRLEKQTWRLRIDGVPGDGVHLWSMTFGFVSGASLDFSSMTDPDRQVTRYYAADAPLIFSSNGEEQPYGWTLFCAQEDSSWAQVHDRK